ncbi:MAG: hypothetical protein JRI68_32080, partial [Deltaproteobacteria bacterium]|nr:hypothetical protein [Deltaproteobacteria bacterium]
MQQHPPLTFALPMLAALATGCAYSGDQVAIESPSAMLHQSSVAGVGVGAR